MMLGPGDARVILIRVETKLDQALATQTDHEARLRVLERARWPLPSLAAVFGFVGTVLGAYTALRG